MQGGGIKDGANNKGSALYLARGGFTRPNQGGFNRSFGRIGPSGPRIDARARLSPATGAGLAEFYADQAMPNEWDRLQNRAMQQQSWMGGTSSPPASPATPSAFPLGNAFTGGSPTFGGMSSGNPFPPSPSTFANLGQLQSNIQWCKKGGPVGEVQPYIVNEEGVEAYQPKGGDPMLIPGPMQMFIPPKDGKIINHRDTLKMMKKPEHRMMGGKVFGGSMTPASNWIPMQNSLARPMMSGISLKAPQARQTGGPVQGFDGMPQASNPWAVKWAMRNAQNNQSSYNQLYNQGEMSGIDMTNAPDNPRALARYLALGRRSQAGVQAGRQAARQSLADSAPLPGPPSFLEYGEGSVQFTPQPTEFFNDAGQSFPWVSQDPWQTTWMQDRALTQARSRTARERPNSRRRDPAIEAEFETIYDSFPL